MRSTIPLVSVPCLNTLSGSAVSNLAAPPIYVYIYLRLAWRARRWCCHSGRCMGLSRLPSGGARLVRWLQSVPESVHPLRTPRRRALHVTFLLSGLARKQLFQERIEVKKAGYPPDTALENTICATLRRRAYHPQISGRVTRSRISFTSLCRSLPEFSRREIAI